jgi:hypothetical protein
MIGRLVTENPGTAKAPGSELVRSGPGRQRSRAEIRLGELIQKQNSPGGPGLNKGGRPPKTGSKSEQVSPPTLAAAGIKDRKLSSRAQKKAKIPPKEADRLIERGRQNIIKGRPAKNILQARREEEREIRRQADRDAAEKVSASQGDDRPPGDRKPRHREGAGVGLVSRSRLAPRPGIGLRQ